MEPGSGDSFVFEGVFLRKDRVLGLGLPALVSQGSLALWGLVSILIARQLPDQAYAAYALSRSISMFAGLLGGGFVLNALLKLGSEKPSRDTSNTANTAGLITAAFSVVSGVLLLTFGDLLNSFYSEIDISGIIPSIVLASVTGSLSCIPRNILLARLRTKQVMQADLLNLLIKGGAVGWLLITGTLTDARQVLLATSAANLGTLVLNGLQARGLVDISAGISREAVRRVFSFAVFSLGTGLANFVYTRTDILMLGKLAPPEDLAAYGASRAITGIVLIVPAAANMILMPSISRAWSEGRRNDIMRRTMKILFLVQLVQLPVVIVLAGFPRWMLDTVYSGKYTENWPILAILGALALIRPFGSLFSTVGSAMGRPQYSFWCVLLSAAVNVPLNALLIPEYGGTGAAVATAFAVFAGTVAVVILTTGRWREGKERK